jgi:hypothetical protein
MATLSHTGLFPAQTSPAIVRTAGATNRRRSISPSAGRALEILSHAIEYLTDEYVYAGGSLSASNPQLQAVQLLMAVNRQIYMECPEVPSLKERILHLFDA